MFTLIIHIVEHKTFNNNSFFLLFKEIFKVLNDNIFLKNLTISQIK